MSLPSKQSQGDENMTPASTPIKGTGFVCALALAAAALTTSVAPLQAQGIEMVEQSGDFLISRVVASKVCFGVVAVKSDKGEAATYATYKTTQGDRWQVAGFVDDTVITPKEAELWITFDGAMNLRRLIGFSKGDFVLPITTEEELAGFDSYVENATQMTLKLVDMDDAIHVDLAGLRDARAAIDTCLEGIE